MAAPPQHPTAPGRLRGWAVALGWLALALGLAGVIAGLILYGRRPAGRQVMIPKAGRLAVLVMPGKEQLTTQLRAIRLLGWERLPTIAAGIDLERAAAILIDRHSTNLARPPVAALIYLGPESQDWALTLSWPGRPPGLLAPDSLGAARAVGRQDVYTPTAGEAVHYPRWPHTGQLDVISRQGVWIVAARPGLARQAAHHLISYTLEVPEVHTSGTGELTAIIRPGAADLAPQLLPELFAPLARPADSGASYALRIWPDSAGAQISGSVITEGAWPLAWLSRALRTYGQGAAPGPPHATGFYVEAPMDRQTEGHRVGFKGLPRDLLWRATPQTNGAFWEWVRATADHALLEYRPDPRGGPPEQTLVLTLANAEAWLDTLSRRQSLTPLGTLQGRTVWALSRSLPQWPSATAPGIVAADTATMLLVSQGRVYLSNSLAQLTDLTAAPPPGAETGQARVSLRLADMYELITRQRGGGGDLATLLRRYPVTISRWRGLTIVASGDRLHGRIFTRARPSLPDWSRPDFVNQFNDQVIEAGAVTGTPQGYALTQTGRMYLYRPGQLSFLQAQLDARLMAPPLRLRPSRAGATQPARYLVATQKTLSRVDSGSGAQRPAALRTLVTLPAGLAGMRLSVGTDGWLAAGITWQGVLHVWSGTADRLDWHRTRLGLLARERPMQVLAGLDRVYILCAGGRLISTSARGQDSLMVSWPVPDTVAFDGGVVARPSRRHPSPTIHALSALGQMYRLSPTAGATLTDFYRPSPQARYSLRPPEDPRQPMWIERADGPLWATYNGSGRRLLEIEVPGGPPSASSSNGTLSPQAGLYATLTDSVRLWGGIGQRIGKPLADPMLPIMIYHRGQGQTWIGRVQGRQIAWHVYED